jgi:hypothetical protein
MTTKTESWLDHMPAIPLARGVPIVCRYTGVKAPEWTEGYGRRAHPQSWRPDLAADAGFIYALRWYNLHWLERGLKNPFPEIEEWVWSYMNGVVDDADRLALARALAEVVA